MMKTIRIMNDCNGKFIADKVKVADHFGHRLKGLLGVKKMYEGEGLMISPCNMVHTIGMRINIDVLFISRKNEILYMIEAMKPYRCSSIIRGSACVLELPAGQAERTGTRVGQRICIYSENE